MTLQQFENNIMNNEIEEKLKGFSTQELAEYHRAVLFVDKFVNMIGVGIILLVLFFTNAFSVVSGLVAIYLLGSFACTISETKQYIQSKLFIQSHVDK